LGKKTTAARQTKPIRVLNIDEIALEKGHGNFVLVLSAPEEGYVLDVLPDRERKTLENCIISINRGKDQEALNTLQSENKRVN